MKRYTQNINIYEQGILLENGKESDDFRLIATTNLPIYAHFNLTIVDHDGKSLNERAVQILSVNGPHAQSDYYQEYDLRYCILSCLYHLNRLIDLYVINTQMFEQQYPEKTTLRGNLHGPNIYYEVDAFLTAARRVYDALSKVVWKHYNPGKSKRWDSVRDMLKNMANVPPQFALTVNDSWKRIGESLRDYRDCIIHFVPLTTGLETCWMEKFHGLWGCNVKLPSNPERKSRRLFEFETGSEALSYCHNVGIEVIDLCEKLKNQTKLGEYLDNPR